MLKIVVAVAWSLSLVGEWQDAGVERERAQAEAAYQEYEAQRKIYYAWQGESYFPEGGLRKGDEDSQYSIAKSVSYSLSGLGEPVLRGVALTGDDVIVRLTLTHSFGGHSAFRAEAKGDVRTLTIKISGASSVGPIESVTETQNFLTDEALERILSRAEMVEREPENWGVLDGAYWIAEVVTAQGYSVTFYHSPFGGPWHDFAREMFGYLGEEYREGFLMSFTPPPPTQERLRELEEAERKMKEEMCADYPDALAEGFCED